MIHMRSYFSSHALPTLAALLVAFSALLPVAISSANAEPAPLETEKWKTDFSKTSIDLKEVISGGPGRDQIPPIDKAKFVSLEKVEEEYYGQEPVIGVEIGGEARAYPLSILIWHEIVNDTLGGKAITVTYCPLCNASIVFDANVDDKKLQFSTTGRLRNNDLLMYDRQSESWWQQYTGEAVIGEMTGKKLSIIPSRLESYDSFKKRHPKGLIMVPGNKDFRDYGRNPYPFYDKSETPFFPLGTQSENSDTPPMAQVVMVRRGKEKPLAISLKTLRKKKSMEIEGVHIEWSSGQNSAINKPRISAGRDIGNVKAYKKTGDDKTSDLAYEVTFAFVVGAFYPDVQIIGIEVSPEADKSEEPSSAAETSEHDEDSPEHDANGND